VPKALGAGVKRPEGEADHPPASSVEDKNGGAIPPIPPQVFMALCLIMHRVNFTFLLLFIPNYPTPWSRVLREKPIAVHTLKKFLVFCETRRFIIVLTKDSH
jgi:hypothetical protein